MRKHGNIVDARLLAYSGTGSSISDFRADPQQYLEKLKAQSRGCCSASQLQLTLTHLPKNPPLAPLESLIVAS